MSDQRQAMLRRAHESIAAARAEMREDLFSDALSDAYYAMFHAARAVLAARGLHFAKHSAVLSAFGSQFAKTGLLPAHMHRTLIDAFEARLKATYDYDTQVTQSRAQQAIEQAEEFVAAIERFLGAPEE